MNFVSILVSALCANLLTISVAQSGNCGSASLSITPSSGNQLTVSLEVKISGFLASKAFDVSVTGFSYERKSKTLTAMQYPGSSPQVSSSPHFYKDQWTVPFDAKDSLVSFPLIKIITSNQFCYAKFPISEVTNKPVMNEIPLTGQSGDDLALVIDSTGSMTDDIAAVRTAATDIVTALRSRSPSAQFAVIEYNDPTASVVLPFSSDEDAVQAAIDGISASGGGDLPEHVYSGLKLALELDWRDGASRSIITMGDAPAKDPEPDTGLTLASIVGLANSIQVPVDLSPSVRFEDGMVNSSTRQSKVDLSIPTKGLNPFLMVPIGSSGTAQASFRNLANQTGGKTFPASDASEVADSIIKAIQENVAEKPTPTPTSSVSPSSMGESTPEPPMPSTPSPRARRVRRQRDILFKLKCSKGILRVKNDNRQSVVFRWTEMPSKRVRVWTATPGISFFRTKFNYKYAMARTRLYKLGVKKTIFKKVRITC